MRIIWDIKAKKTYELFQKKDKKIFIKIQKLLESIGAKYDYGIGKPERLKGYNEKMVYSRHIDDKNRLIYEVTQNDEQEISITILRVKGHYDDK